MLECDNLENRIGKVINKINLEIDEIKKQNTDLERHGNASSSSAVVPYKTPQGVNPGGFRRGSGLGDFMSGLGGMGGGPS